MKTSRREFVLKASLGLAGSSLFFRTLNALPEGNRKLGIQLYSIRNDMKADPLEGLKKVSDIGYKYVEHADYREGKFYGYAPKDFKKIIADLGLEMPSGHTVLNKNHWDEYRKDFTDPWKQLVDDAATVGQEFVISPWLDESLRQTQDGLKWFMDVFNRCGELCHKSGLKYGYHNHDFEFSHKIDGITVYDLIMQYTDPKLVIQQLDIGNMLNGGARAVDIINKYPGRFQSLHVKDEIKSSGGNHEYESTVLGKGIVGVKEVIELGRKKGGTVHFIIEQEAYQGMTPLACIEEDFRQMKKWGY